jgi:hypothetical protein
METAIQKSVIQTDLQNKGYVHVTHPESKNFEEIIHSLGEIIQQTEIKENPNSTRLLASHHEMGFHTDHHAANYIAWFCNSQSAIGGESILLDTKGILCQFTESSRSLLQEINVNTHQVFYKDKLSLPLLSIIDSKTSVYYAEWLVNQPHSIKHQRALSKFQELIKSIEPIKILLSEGDLLIIDNHRMLHGRSAFPEKSNRWLTRYWIKSNQY